MSREGVGKTTRFIESEADLSTYFFQGAKTSEESVIGIESERIGVNPNGGEAAPFEGQDGIEALLVEMGGRGGWQRTIDQGRCIGLTRGKEAVTLEPGGQLEYSSAPLRHLNDLERALKRHDKDLEEVSIVRGLTWLYLGLQPITPLGRIPWVPKSRYEIMKPYYERRNGLALEMMGRTASIQVNLDYESEEDASRKVFVGALLGPIVGAMTANSCVEEGKLNGYLNRRLVIWAETDSDRCGSPVFFTDGSFSFNRYRDYAMDVPMYFVSREGRYIDMRGKTFRKFLSEPGEFGPARISDWELHLTTLFPDVRLKDHLEFRTADSLPTTLTMALAAFWVGLLYDRVTLSEAVDCLRRDPVADLRSVYLDVVVRGLEASWNERHVLDVARDMVSLSVVGLGRRDRDLGTNDVRYLDPLRDILERGRSPADEIRARWKGDPGFLFS